MSIASTFKRLHIQLMLLLNVFDGTWPIRDSLRNLAEMIVEQREIHVDKIS